MQVKQIYTGCLAQGAYYISSNGEAAIIDPLREVQPYIDMAKENGDTIKYIFETHFHADFVSGHLTLSEKTGAPIIYGPLAETSFDAHIAKDGEEFKVGDLTITALHTPGHTMESTTYLLKDVNGKDTAIFTGDTLFLGDVGRPDVAQKGLELTVEDLAGHLFESLRTKIMPLADDLTVYPAHGAGSACGKNMMKITQDTLGNQKAMNYALRSDMTKEEFVKTLTDGLEEPPAYFPQNVKMNQEGYTHIDEVLKAGSRPLNPKEFKAAAESTEALILDVRTGTEFVKSHIPGSIFIGLDGGFAPWVGALIKDTEQKILLVVNEERAEEAVTRLARVGFDHTLGFLSGGMTAWASEEYETDSIDRISPEDFSKILRKNDDVIDVRKISEFDSGHIVNACNIPLSTMNEHMSEIPDSEFFLHCAGGYRSMIAASILKSRGIHNFKEIEKGMSGIRTTDITINTTQTANT